MKTDIWLKQSLQIQFHGTRDLLQEIGGKDRTCHLKQGLRWTLLQGLQAPGNLGSGGTMRARVGKAERQLWGACKVPQVETECLAPLDSGTGASPLSHHMAPLDSGTRGQPTPSTQHKHNAERCWGGGVTGRYFGDKGRIESSCLSPLLVQFKEKEQEGINH